MLIQRSQDAAGASVIDFNTLICAAEMQDCFEFHHPNWTMESNDRCVDLDFEIEAAHCDPGLICLMASGALIKGVLTYPYLSYILLFSFPFSALYIHKYIFLYNVFFYIFSPVTYIYTYIYIYIYTFFFQFVFSLFVSTLIFSVRFPKSVSMRQGSFSAVGEASLMNLSCFVL